MNSLSNQTAEKAPKRRRWDADDYEFLPAALELLETPPSPIKIALLNVICCLVAIGLLWAYVGRVDIVATAQGKIQPVGAVKLIQSLETGRLRQINVQNGTKVKAGDILFLLDDVDALADLQMQKNLQTALKAELFRRVAAIEAVRLGDLKFPVLRWDPDIPQNIKEREINVLTGELSQTFAIVASYQAQQDQKSAEALRLMEMIASQEKQIAISEERIFLRNQLVQMELGSRLQLLDAREGLQQQRTSLAQLKGQLAEALASNAFLQREVIKSTETFISENSQKLADADKQLDDVVQRVAKAEAKIQRMMIRSPIDGTIQSLAISTLGQVISTGNELMRIIPTSTSFEIESYFANKDIGFLEAGQEAVVKLDAFPFTRYGSISAKVLRIAKDAMPEPDAQSIEGTPSVQKRPSMFASADRVQNLVFPVTLTPEVKYMNVDGLKVELSSGMSVTVEIKTGRRRILEFLFSPFVEVGSKSMGER